MSTPDEPIDESAIRSQMEAALERMPMPLDPVEPGAERRSGRSNRARKDDPHLHKGVVTAVQGNEVLVELGPRTQGVISIDEFETPPEPGQEFEFSLVSITDGLWTLSRKEARTLATWQELQKGRSVKATVIGQNSGGLELKVGPVSAFMPASEIALHRVDDLLPFVGQTLVCEVMEVAPKRKRVVLSRKAVLARERRESRERTLASLAKGQVVTGTVEKLEPFGAFVDIGGGLSGLLHVSNIAHQRVDDPAAVLSVGQKVEVQVLEIKEGGKRIGLGMKQLQVDPWEAVKEKYRPGSVVKGTVVRHAEFGAFVELEPGIEGLVHRSQLAPERVNRVEDAVKVGEAVTVRVQSVDVRAKRVSLSRLSERGALIGSDEDLGHEELRNYLDTGRPTGGTNLGALLREALAKKGQSPG